MPRQRPLEACVDVALRHDARIAPLQLQLGIQLILRLFGAPKQAFGAQHGSFKRSGGTFG
jgi:hypothetical protein